MTSLCAWKRQVIRSSEHIREASLTSVDLHHSVQWERSLASGSYTQSNLLAPSVGLKTTLLSHNFMAGFTQCFVPLTLQNLETVLLTLTYISNDFANDWTSPQYIMFKTCFRPLIQTDQQHLHDGINFKIVLFFKMRHFLDMRGQLEKCNMTESSLFQATDVQLLPCLYIMENMTGLLCAELRSDMFYKPLQQRTQILSDERGLAAFRNTVNPVKMSTMQ